MGETSSQKLQASGNAACVVKILSRGDPGLGLFRESCAWPLTPPANYEKFVGRASRPPCRCAGRSLNLHRLESLGHLISAAGLVRRIPAATGRPIKTIKTTINFSSVRLGNCMWSFGHPHPYPPPRNGGKAVGDVAGFSYHKALNRESLSPLPQWGRGLG